MIETSGHFIAKCKHGTIVNQCRCPAPNKLERRVDCPFDCEEANKDLDILEGGGDLNYAAHFALAIEKRYGRPVDVLRKMLGR